MKWLNKGKILYWLRSVHRDLGFLLVGVCFIYGISGFLLNHMNGKDPAFKTRKEVIDIEGNLTKEELEKQWLEILRLPPVKKNNFDRQHAHKSNVRKGNGYLYCSKRKTGI